MRVPDLHPDLPIPHPTIDDLCPQISTFEFEFFGNYIPLGAQVVIGLISILCTLYLLLKRKATEIPYFVTF